MTQSVPRTLVLRDVPRLWRERLSWKLGMTVGVMGAMLLLMVVVAAIALQYVLRVSEQRADAQQQAQMAYQLRGDIQGYTAVLLDMAWTHTDRSEELGLNAERFVHDLQTARTLELEADDQELLTSLGAQFDEYRALGNTVAAQSQSGHDSDAAISWISGKDMAARAYDIADRYFRAQSEQAEAARQLAERSSQIAIVALIAAALLALVLGGGLMITVSRHLVRTLGHLTAAAQQVASGKQTTVPVEDTDELGALAGAFNAMSRDLAEQRAAREGWSQQLEQQVELRTRELQEALAQQQRLGEYIRQMSTPVIPVLDGVLVMPLVGTLDDERIQQVQAALLSGIEQERAHTVILDITGIPLVDTNVAQHLLQAIQAAKLLGAQSMVVGISPEVAQTLVGLGVNLSSIRTLSDLRTAVMHVVAVNRPVERLRLLRAAG